MKTQNQEMQEILMGQLRKLTGEGMKNPITRERELVAAHAITGITTSLINSAKVELQFMKQTDTKESKYFQEDVSVGLQLPGKVQEETPYLEMEKPLTQIKTSSAREDAALLNKKKPYLHEEKKKTKSLYIDDRTTVLIDFDADPVLERANFIAKMAVYNKF